MHVEFLVKDPTEIYACMIQVHKMASGIEGIVVAGGRATARPWSLGGKGVKLHPPAPALLPPGILLPSLYGAAHTCMVRAVLYCTVRARARVDARAGLKSFPGARARVLGKISTNPAEFCMHY